MKPNLIKRTKLKEKTDHRLTLLEQPDSGELEICQPATAKRLAKEIICPKDTTEQYKMPPPEFVAVQNAIEGDREVKVYANSIESRIGYDSLLRVLGNYFGRQIAYFRSEAGGSLSVTEARERAYQRKFDEAEAEELLNRLLATPTDRIGFAELLALHQNSAAMAENLWEMIKREAQREFESGHRAADAFESADYMNDAWNRASYLGLRESLCEEWKPMGGIELTMIDAIAQAWLQLQFWTEQSVLRAKTEARREDPTFFRWKQVQKEKEKNQQWKTGEWDIPYVSEQGAIEHAAQMADRWQRMYFRAIRYLRDWRRYTPQVTINNPNQVNIANDGGQQVNISNADNQMCGS